MIPFHSTSGLRMNSSSSSSSGTLVQSFIEKIQAIRQKNEKEAAADSSVTDLQCELTPERARSLVGVGSMPLDHTIQSFRTFVATWNVAGKSPNKGLNLDDFLHAHDPADIYVLGFQEIVPLNAGNVLVIEDNEPAAKWLTMINQSLNKPPNMGNREWKNGSTLSGSLFFAKPSLKRISKIFRTESRQRLKACNCSPTELERKNSKDFCFRCNQQSFISEEDLSTDEDDDDDSNPIDMSGISSPQRMKYSLVASKQMVGIFVCVWMRTELIQYVGHLRISCLSRGIMGCLGNKVSSLLFKPKQLAPGESGCISVSMTFHQTSFCFVCGHLASGEKEGDELRRNLDVIETLKNTQFRKVCRSAQSRIPLKILGHDRVIWLGDLNYRIALNYSETRKLMAENEWDALLNKDQLKIEREAGRVFKGWKEGKIYFAPTYKYSYNSDAYAGENMKSKKRRTPAWCDRILWYGEGIRQAYYIRGESRFSDHRPVCAEFLIDVAVECGLRRGMSGPNMKIGPEELLPTMVRYARERSTQ